MLDYILRRVLTMIPTLLVISLLVFVIIQLPPGDYLESHIAELQSQGESVDEQKIAFLREEYGLDRPFYEQYFFWLVGMAWHHNNADSWPLDYEAQSVCSMNIET